MTDLATPGTLPLADSAATLSMTPNVEIDRAEARRDRLDELQRRRAVQSLPVAESASDHTPQVLPDSDQAAPQTRATRPARAGAAHASKAAAAGFGLAGMLSLVAVMGVNSASSAPIPPPTPVQTTRPAQVIVVLHPSGTVGTRSPTEAPATVSPSETSGAVGQASGQASGQALLPEVAPAPAIAGGPIVLTAQPVVRQAPSAPAAQAPVAQTNGSR